MNSQLLMGSRIVSGRVHATPDGALARNIELARQSERSHGRRARRHARTS